MKQLKDTAKALLSLIDMMHGRWIQSTTDQRVTISPGTIQVLRYLRQHPGVGIMDITRWTGLAKPTVSLIVKDLVIKGIVRREIQQEDARRICLYLTEAGDQMNHIVQEYRGQKAEKLLSALGKEELAIMDELMVKILNHWRKGDYD